MAEPVSRVTRFDLSIALVELNEADDAAYRQMRRIGVAHPQSMPLRQWLRPAQVGHPFQVPVGSQLVIKRRSALFGSHIPPEGVGSGSCDDACLNRSVTATLSFCTPTRSRVTLRPDYYLVLAEGRRVIDP